MCLILDGLPHVCGGKDMSNCIRYNPQTDIWHHSGNLSFAHYIPGFTLHSQLGLVITGNDRNDKEKSETTVDGQDIKAILYISSDMTLKTIIDKFTGFY